MKNEIEHVRILESTGLNRKNAEKHLKVINGAIMDNVATKEGLKEVKTGLKQEIGSVRTELKQDIKDVKSYMDTNIERLDLKIEAMGDKIVLRLGVYLTAVMGVYTGVISCVIAFAGK